MSVDLSPLDPRIPEILSLYPHEHQWLEVTELGDRVRVFVCGSCPATRKEPF